MKKLFYITLVFLCLISFSIEASTLKGSKHAVEVAYQEALRHDFTFIKTEAQLDKFIKNQWLVPLEGSQFYQIDSSVQYPFVRAEVRVYVQQLSERMYLACDERLVVTSALRLTTNQPRNASKKSVHPAGIALDIRVPRNNVCKNWLEAFALFYEDKGVVEATKERWPPHYHLVIFPRQYAEHMMTMANRDYLEYKIKAGDVLSNIAKRYGTTVRELVVLNGLKSPDKIYPNQKILLR